MEQILTLLHDTDIEQRLQHLSRQRLDRLRMCCGKVIEAKFSPHRLRKPLYANLPREMNRAQVLAFFTELQRFGNDGVTRAFLRQFFYGLRIGEIQTCKLVPGGFLQIINQKDNGTVDYLPIIPGTEPLFEPLNNGKGYSTDYLRKYFTETCDRLGDEYRYQYAVDKAGRKRRQFSTHTLRKTAANALRSATKDAYKASVFLRHETRAVFGITAVYLNYPLEEMKEDLMIAFAPYMHLIEKTA